MSVVASSAPPGVARVRAPRAGLPNDARRRSARGLLQMVRDPWGYAIRSNAKRKARKGATVSAKHRARHAFASELPNARSRDRPTGVRSRRRGRRVAARANATSVPSTSRRRSRQPTRLSGGDLPALTTHGRRYRREHTETELNEASARSDSTSSRAGVGFPLGAGGRVATARNSTRLNVPQGTPSSAPIAVPPPGRCSLRRSHCRPRRRTR